VVTWSPLFWNTTLCIPFKVMGCSGGRSKAGNHYEICSKQCGLIFNGLYFYIVLYFRQRNIPLFCVFSTCFDLRRLSSGATNYVFQLLICEVICILYTICFNWFLILVLEVIYFVIQVKIFSLCFFSQFLKITIFYSFVLKILKNNK
jgi:hypothetical protein